MMKAGSIKRGSTNLSGILAIDKPAGMTSHDVISFVRRISGERRVGHCGTLDPFATGVLLVCVGPATRLADYLMAQRKSYSARIAFGVATDTDDATGSVIETAPVADRLSSSGFARAYLERLVGVHQQIPPQYSAIKRDGVKAYEAARCGSTVALKPRSIEVFAASLEAPPVALAHCEGLLCWETFFVVSKGTYIRALARDIACDLGTVGHLAALRRTQNGVIDLSKAYTLSDLEKQGVRQCFLDPVYVLDLPVLTLGNEQRRFVENGRPLPLQTPNATMVACVHGTALLALYKYSAQHNDLRPLVVIPGGVCGEVSDASGSEESSSNDITWKG